MKMVSKLLSIVVLSLAIHAGYANAEEVSSDVEVTAEAEATDVQHIHWDVLGCVHDDHECHHMAEDRGFHHHKVTFDSTHYCGHDHHYVVCWGGHH